MKLMIDIPEETYNKMRRGEALYPADANVAIFAIETGTPLSESEDCVSRQAAIDAIKKLHSIETEYDCTLYEKLDVLYELEDLPPVTPAEKVGHWIPVSERLPGWHWETAGGEKFWVGERVLACVKEADEYYDLVGVATYGPYGWESSDEDFCSCYASKPVIAWMPLPLPYKQEVEE